MNVLPQDLGEKRCEMIVSQRAGTALAARWQPDEPLGFWGHLWLGKLQRQLSSKEAQPILQAARPLANWSTSFGLVSVPLAVGTGFGIANNAHNPLPGLFCFGVVGA